MLAANFLVCLQRACFSLGLQGLNMTLSAVAVFALWHQAQEVTKRKASVVLSVLLLLTPSQQGGKKELA